MKITLFVGAVSALVVLAFGVAAAAGLLPFSAHRQLLHLTSTANTLPEVDCRSGTVVRDVRGQKTAATMTATHIYARVWDGMTSNNECGTYTLPVAAPKTFRALNAFYAVDKSAVWFIDNPTDEGGPDFYKIVGADPSTFALIADPYLNDFSYGYTKDNGHVFYFGEAIPGADPNTFALVDPAGSNSPCPFVDARDARESYYRGRSSSIDCAAYGQ
jgi:DKNYY family